MMVYVTTYSSERDNGKVYLTATTTGLSEASLKFFSGSGYGEESSHLYTVVSMEGSLAEVQALVSTLQAELLELGAKIRNKQREEAESNDAN